MRSTIAALRQRRCDLLKSAKNMLTVAEKERRDLNEDEQAAHYRTLKALESLEREIIVEESRLTGEDCGPAFVDQNSLFAAAAQGLPLPENPLAPRKRKAVGRVGCKNWRDIFGAEPRTSGGFASAEEFFHAVRVSGEVFDPRLRAAMTESDATSAGFLVPEQWSAVILQRAIEDSLCMSRCQLWPMSSNVLKVPGIQDPDHSSGYLFGDVREIWYDENEEIDDQNLKSYMIQLTAHKLGLLSSGSSEIVEDSPAFETVLTAKLQAAAEFFLDRAYLFGTGTAKPLGMLDPDCKGLVTVQKDANTPAAWITLEDVLNMFAAMAPSCRLRAEWVFTDELIPALYKMQNVVENKAHTENVGGASTAVFVPDGKGGGSLLGRPVHFSEKMKPAGQVGDSAFLAFDQFAVGLRREIQLRRSVEAGFVRDQVYWRLTTRVDGQSTWDSTMKLSNGNIVGPFVTLAART